MVSKINGDRVRHNRLPAKLMTPALEPKGQEFVCFRGMTMPESELYFQKGETFR
jgi:hypothetical protein